MREKRSLAFLNNIVIERRMVSFGLRQTIRGIQEHLRVTLPRQNTDQMPFPGYEKIREKFFDNEMVDTLVNCTNKKLESYRQQISNYAKHELKDTNAVEIRSLLGVQKLRSP